MAAVDDQRTPTQILPGDVEQATEQTPLLDRGNDGPELPDQSQPQRQHSAYTALKSVSGLKQKSSSKRRWPSILALILLCLAIILIIILGFIAPSAVEEYANEAADFKPISLSIASLTSSGVSARVKGDFIMDASRVKNKWARDFGMFATGIAKEVESEASVVEVRLPEYGDVIIGTVDVPPVKVDIRNGHTTHVDITSNLTTSNTNGIRKVASDWIDGRLGSLRVLVQANVPIKSGIFTFGTQTILHELYFANEEIPAIPEYKIKKLNIRDVDTSSGNGMAAEVSLEVQNIYPLNINIPPLGFDILVDNCQQNDPPIMVAEATTHSIHVLPKHDVELNVTGVVRQLPDTLTEACPGSSSSPLDALLGRYMHGETNTLYVRGSKSPSPDTPKWMADLMSSVTVPVPLPGRTFGHLIKNFSLTDTHFSLPAPDADENSPDAMPRISAKVKAIAALPEEMNFNVSVGRVRADTDVFYKGRKLGKLDLHKWQHANSVRLPVSKEEGPLLAIESRVENAPLQISDDDVFADVVQALIFGGSVVILDINAEVDIEIDTALGELTVKRIPATGSVPVKPIIAHNPGHGSDNGGLESKFKPRIGNLTIVDTSKTSITIDAMINVTNPTNYSASVPYVDVHILSNGSIIAHAVAKDVEIKPGENTNLLGTAIWQPLDLGGQKAASIARELLSQYISGYNTTLTLRTHKGTIPAQPALGRALSNLSIEIPTPRLDALGPPKTGDGDKPDDRDKPETQGPHFIEDATMHLISSTATFMLLSPLRTSTLYVESVNATAFYRESGADEDEVVGRIQYDYPFAVPPVDEDGNGVQTPRLPVDWSLGSVGYDAVRKALGGTLRLSAYADVGIRIGKFREKVWFRGRGIGAKIRL